MAGGHAGIGLERLLQLAQRNPGDVRKLEQIERFFRRVGSPLTYPFHDHSFFVAPLQTATVEIDSGVIEDEQTIFK